MFLVLAAQYESWTLPGAVMTAVPFGILGALITNWLRGLDNDVYFQIGLLVLIGLGAKNAVLRVSAAVEFRHQGKSIMEATVLAGEQRLRPIIMTSLAFAAGCLPLALALGAGANARHSIGTGIIGGMIGETTLAMLYVPLLFYLFDQLAERNEKAADAAAVRRRPPPHPAPAGGAGARAARAAGGRVDAVARFAATESARSVRMRWHAARRSCSPVAAVLVAGAARSARTTSRPKVDAPAAFRFEPAKVADTANTAWWKQFGDPVLDQLIDDALANNKNVKIAAANVEQAAAVLTQTRSQLFPQIGYPGTRQRERFPRHGIVAVIPHYRIRPTAYQALLTRELGDRPLGAHPAPVRVGAGEPARDRRSAPRRDPVARGCGRHQLPARCAGSTSSSTIAKKHARHLRRIA